MKNRFWILLTIAASLLLLPVLVSSAQPDATSAENPTSDRIQQPDALRGNVVGTLLIKAETDPALLANAIEVIDYGLYQWAIFPAGTAAVADLETTSFRLALGNSTIDTSVTAASTAARSDEPAAGKDFHLVQLVGPVKTVWRTAIEEANLDVVQYIYPFTYVVYGEQADVDGMNSAEFVRYTDHFSADYRVLPYVQNEATRNTETIEYKLVVYRGANEQVLRRELAAIANDDAVELVTLNDTWSATNLVLSRDQLEAAGRLPGVFTIQTIPTDGGLRSELSNQITVRNLIAGTVQTGYRNWLNQVGVDGEGVIVADVDGGIQQSHVDLVDNMLPCTGSTCGGNVTDSHGTHTAGIIAGTGASGTLRNGFLRGLGVAPSANLIEQLYNPTFTQAGGMLTLMRQSAENNAVISANSWGPAGTPRGYDNDTMQVDIGARDADPNTLGNQELTYILSFMNGNGGFQSQGTPDEAKNIFTIGSSNAQSGGVQSNDLFSLSANSAHGPARDGRIIPHMIAPGCRVDSTVPTNSYGYQCGTSMASPHVSGGAALFFEKYRAVYGADPSPALVKAAFTVVADTMAGNDDADDNQLGHPFDSKQGWGLFNLAEIISPTLPTFYIDQSELLTATGQTYSITVEAAVPDQPVRAMLAWTDAPGHGLGGTTPAWNNNLDILALHDGASYTSNQFDANGWSTPSSILDGRNNTEALFFESVAAGKQIVLTVAAADLNSDGVPANGIDVDQDFALACYNCKLVTNTAPTAVTLTLEKTYSPASVAPSTFAVGLGASTVVTVNITRTVSVTEAGTMSATLTEPAISGVTVLSNTIRVDGVLQPSVFNRTSGDIVISSSAEPIIGNKTTRLSYQAHMNDDAPVGQIVTGTATTSVIVNTTVADASADTLWMRLVELFLPQIMQDSP